MVVNDIIQNAQYKNTHSELSNKLMQGTLLRKMFARRLAFKAKFYPRSLPTHWEHSITFGATKKKPQSMLIVP